MRILSQYGTLPGDDVPFVPVPFAETSMDTQGVAAPPKLSHGAVIRTELTGDCAVKIKNQRRAARGQNEAAEEVDRRRKYDAIQAEQGFSRVTVRSHQDDAERIKTYAARLLKRRLEGD